MRCNFYFCFMRNVLFLFTAFIFVCANLNKGNKNVESDAKSSLEILVIDASTEEPITAAKVIIDQKIHEAYTDFDGVVKFTEVIKGPHDIEISFISYKKQQIKAFQLNNDNNKLIVKLKP